MSKGCRFGVAVFLLSALPALADPPPIDAYADLQIHSARLSPDGDSLAMIAAIKDRQTLIVRKLDGGQTVAVPTGDTFPDWFQWKSSKRLLASVRFTADIGRVGAVAETRMVFIDADGTNAAMVKLNKMPAPGTFIYGRVGNRIPQFQDRVVSLLPGDPDHVMMAVTPENDFLHPELLKIDIHNGHAALEQRGVADVTDFYVDSDGVARGAVKIDRATWNGTETRRTVLARASREAEWKTINEAEFNHQFGKRLVPLGFFSGTPNLFYVLSEGEGGHLVGRGYDVTTGQFGPVIAGDARCDALALLHDHDVVGFRLPCADNKSTFFDAAWQHDWDIVTKALKTNLVYVVDRSAEGKRTLLTVQETRTSPVAYWLIDRRGAKTDVHWIGEAYEKVPHDQIAQVSEVSYKARDGLTIPALITMPVNAPSGPIPFVVLPHGGPTFHDEVHFDWMVQFLASRGYGVLQPQYRGSNGYGAAFEEAGYAQWGLAMQDDITDGTRWLIDQKMADPARICIVGGSYGGYAALMGVIKEPALYACAAAFAPVTDVAMFQHRIREFAFKDINLPRVADSKQDIDAISPTENADKIRVPVLLVHGDKDFNVPVEHSEEMERALKRAGKPVEAIYLKGADHFFSQGSDRTAWLQALEKLLATSFNKAEPAKTAGSASP